MTEQIWKPVVGWEGFYTVSNHGEVKSVVRNRLLKPNIDTKGYCQVKLYYGDSPKTVFIHVLVLEAFSGPKPDGFESRHLDGNKRNNQRSNLKWGTPKENASDRITHGRQVNQKGEDHWNAILTEHQIIEIRGLYKSRLGSQRGLARRFHVHRSTICDIVHDRTWRGVA